MAVPLLEHEPAPGSPTGTVTFLMTDVEGSTRLWDEDPEAMKEALERHDRIVVSTVEAHGGHVVRTKGEGDSAFAVFPSAAGALAGALALQRVMVAEPWPTSRPLRVRMALHTGEAELREGDYYGSAVNRCARLRAIASGGQTLLSLTTRTLAGDALPTGATLRDLGAHRLRDLTRPEQVFQLCHPDLPEDFPPLRSLEGLQHNLPVQLTTFVGREQEMAEVRALLEATRLLTLTGTGGCGKTRLALQVAAGIVDDYGGGVWLIELGGLSDEGVVPSAAAAALGIREEVGRAPADTLAEHLRTRRALILLDNCEHVVGACAGLAERLLRDCPDVSILATSRQPLAVAGERTWRVPSMSLPDQRVPPAPDGLLRFEAVRLFVERAALHRADFQLTASNAVPVTAICHRLDGIPLAIELAAARVGVLTVEQIQQRLDDRFKLLTRGSRTALERHQTLLGAVEWSHDLLSDRERAVFRCLSVFAGGFTLEAAEAVCPGPDVLEPLSGLVEKSLVHAEERAGDSRYRMLETVREYAGERLRSSDEQRDARARFVAWCVTLAERAEPELTGPEQVAWLGRLEAERDNLRAALTLSANRGRHLSSALLLGAALWRFWLEHGYLSEGRGWLEYALSQPDGVPPEVRAKALRAAGAVAMWQADEDAAQAFHEEALAIARTLGDAEGVAFSLNHLGVVATGRGDYEAARALFEETLATRRDLGDRQGVGVTLGNLGLVAQRQGDYAAARALLEESLAIDRELGHRMGIAGCLTYLGEVARAEGDLERARALHREGLALQRELGGKEVLPLALVGLGRLAAAKGDLPRAARLFGAAEALREEMRVPMHPASAPAGYEDDVARVREALGTVSFVGRWGDGRRMALEEAIAYALEEGGA